MQLLQLPQLQDTSSGSEGSTHRLIAALAGHGFPLCMRNRSSWLQQRLLLVSQPATCNIRMLHRISVCTRSHLASFPC
jgi:hypothetical protein